MIKCAVRRRSSVQSFHDTRERRDGSYVIVMAAAIDAFAPVVAHLAGS